MGRRVAAAMLLFVICRVSPAQMSELYGKCISSAGNQLAMRACANDEAARADVELDDVYRKSLSATGTQIAAAEKIRASQRAWIAYRDAYMDAMYPAQDKHAAYGSIFPMEFDLVRAKLTRQYTGALKELLKRYGGSTQ